MKTRICPNCGKNIPSDAITCKFCGRLQFSDGNDIDAENAYPAPEDLPPEDDTFEDGEYEDYDGEYEDYDDGYDDVWMDGDYDVDEYERNQDYADGVDDAIDEGLMDW